jgi:hypothetical protein
VLAEYANVQQIPGQRRRRWFHSLDEDLIVWYSDDGSLYGFQLCYDKQRSERALTWLPPSGFSHHRVDDGEGPPLTYKRTPILVADGEFDACALAHRFAQVSETLPPEIFEFVSGKLREHARRSAEPPRG